MTNSPFHDPQQNPLPDANDIENANEGAAPTANENIALYSYRQISDARDLSPHIKQDMRRLRNVFIWLIVIGAALGAVMGIGAAIILKRTGLLEPPKDRPQSALASQMFALTQKPQE